MRTPSTPTPHALRCPFCQAPMGDPQVRQIDPDSYVAALPCSGCVASITTRVPERTIGQAIRAVRQLWSTLANATPGR